MLTYNLYIFKSDLTLDEYAQTFDAFILLDISHASCKLLSYKHKGPSRILHGSLNEIPSLSNVPKKNKELVKRVFCEECSDWLTPCCVWLCIVHCLYNFLFRLQQALYNTVENHSQNTPRSP